jgi:hypothetical protein
MEAELLHMLQGLLAVILGCVVVAFSTWFVLIRR